MNFRNKALFQIFKNLILHKISTKTKLQKCIQPNKIPNRKQKLHSQWPSDVDSSPDDDLQNDTPEANELN